MTTPWALVRAAAGFAFGGPEGVPSDDDIAAWRERLKSTGPDIEEEV